MIAYKATYNFLMIAYKATYNFKCRNQEYKIGKTYTSDKLQICKHGFHFCLKMEDTLNYYTYDKNFVLLEVEILGNTEFEDDKGVTDKMRVIRVVSPEEYSEEMKKMVPVWERDDKGNVISATYPDGDKFTFEYDDKGNKISETYPSGEKSSFEYDEKGNRISETYSVDGSKHIYEYDDKGNKISETLPNGGKFIYEYDDKGNKISETFPSGNKYSYEYDDKGNKISETFPHGAKLTCEITQVTEE